jgi:hypothetical protein
MLACIYNLVPYRSLWPFMKQHNMKTGRMLIQEPTLGNTVHINYLDTVVEVI